MRCWQTTTGVMAMALLVSTGCGGSSGGPSSGRTVIVVEGSDTMVNLAQAWAEAYNKAHPEVSVQVSGGGSGVGIASLIDGVAEMANASRKMKDTELKRAEANTGERPQEFVVALDALAVYVHPDNPLESITLEQLADIYGEGGQTTKWSQLGVENTACKTDEITRVSRQNNSGTYHYFREAVLGDARDYKLGSIDQSGSKDVVALISKTPCAIGYSGMGYRTEAVKWLPLARKSGEPGVEPSVAAAKDGSYPIARPLLIYMLGEPSGAVKDYLDWIQSAEGQRIVAEMGYVPMIEVDAAATAAGAVGSPEPAAAETGEG